MTNDVKEKLHDGSFRVTQLGRHDGELFVLPAPIEYKATCTRLAISKKGTDWKDTADKWDISINGVSFDYYTGAGHRKDGKPVKPELSSILYSLVLDASACDEGFGDWCDTFGYDTDSRKALETYLSCQETGARLRKAGIHVSDDLREFLAEY